MLTQTKPYNIYEVCMCSKGDTFVKTSGRCITQLVKMGIDPKFVDLTADVFRIIS